LKWLSKNGDGVVMDPKGIAAKATAPLTSEKAPFEKVAEERNAPVKAPTPPGFTNKGLFTATVNAPFGSRDAATEVYAGMFTKVPPGVPRYAVDPVNCTPTLVMVGGWPGLSLGFPFPNRNCGCPVIAFFARAGTMLPIAWACHAGRGGEMWAGGRLPFAIVWHRHDTLSAAVVPLREVREERGTHNCDTFGS
jgi:hypothetical protein